MIKFTAIKGGRPLLGIGLSFGNLKTFLREPLDTFINIDGKEMGLPFDVMIFSGETEASMQKAMQKSIGPHTKLHIDPKLKS